MRRKSKLEEQMAQIAAGMNGVANTLVRCIDGSVFYTTMPDTYGVDDMLKAVKDRYGECTLLMESADTVGVRLKSGIVKTFRFERKG